MKLDFQKDILKFLAQRKAAKPFIQTIESDLFTDGYDYLAYGIIKTFFEKYSTQPTKIECIEELRKVSKEKEKDVTPEIYAGIEKAIIEAYKPYVGKEDFIKDRLIELYQVKLTKDLFKDRSSDLKDASSDTVRDIYREMNRINSLSNNSMEEQEQNRGSFLIKDHVVGDYSVVEGTPTFLKGLNKMTGIGGFSSPELIVFMSGPKRFKTGTALNIALGFVREGKKVYYVDTENGQKAIEDRMKQSMLQCTHRELVNGVYDSELEEQIGRYGIRGGDFKCDFYPATTKTIDDVAEELDYLKDEFDWIPDMLFYDNLDNLAPVDKSIKEKRLQIQNVYFAAIRLNKRRNIFSITLSQVGRNAVDKRIIEMTDFAEDFGKAANCHSAFAICADEFEMQAGVRRLVPVVQRMGVDASSKAACYIKLDASRQYIEEITYEQWKEKVEAVEKNAPPPKKEIKGRKPRPTLKRQPVDK